MANLPSGILTPPQGKLSSSLWISPYTGKVYSPAPKHVDKRSPKQLEHRRRLKLVGPYYKLCGKDLIKPFWGKMRRPFTGYNMAVQSTLRNYHEYAGLPALSPLGVRRSDLAFFLIQTDYPSMQCFIRWYPGFAPPLTSGTRIGVFIFSHPGRKYWFSGWLNFSTLTVTALPIQFDPLGRYINQIHVIGIRVDLAGLWLLQYVRADDYFLGAVV